MNYKKGSFKQKSKHVVWNDIIHINRTSRWFKSPSQHFGATTKGISPYNLLSHTPSQVHKQPRTVVLATHTNARQHKLNILQRKIIVYNEQKVFFFFFFSICSCLSDKFTKINWMLDLLRIKTKFKIMTVIIKSRTMPAKSGSSPQLMQ